MYLTPSGSNAAAASVVLESVMPEALAIRVARMARFAIFVEKKIC